MCRNGKFNFIAGISALFVAIVAGCETREKMIDVQTPRGHVEVDKVTEPNGETRVDVDVHRDKPILPRNEGKKIDVDVDVNK